MNKIQNPMKTNYGIAQNAPSFKNAEHFPFGLESTYELKKINMDNSIELVEMIPEFEINLQILGVDDLFLRILTKI